MILYRSSLGRSNSDTGCMLVKERYEAIENARERSDSHVEAEALAHLSFDCHEAVQQCPK